MCWFSDRPVIVIQNTCQHVREDPELFERYRALVVRRLNCCSGTTGRATPVACTCAVQQFQCSALFSWSIPCSVVLLACGIACLFSSTNLQVIFCFTNSSGKFPPRKRYLSPKRLNCGLAFSEIFNLETRWSNKYSHSQILKYHLVLFVQLIRFMLGISVQRYCQPVVSDVYAKIQFLRVISVEPDESFLISYISWLREWPRVPERKLIMDLWQYKKYEN